MGCASIQKHYSWNDVNRVVEPQPDTPHGYLKVFTPVIYQRPIGADYSYPHEPYTLFSSEGKKIKRVENHSSSEDENPTTVALPPGKYVVVPASIARTKEVIGAVIKDQKLTEVRFTDSGLDQATREELQRQ